MLSIKNVVSSLVSSDAERSAIKSKKYAIAIDISGSTGSPFPGFGSVLNKELDVVKKFIESNPQNDYILYSFDSCCEKVCDIPKNTKKVKIPDLSPRGGTSTHTAFYEINKLKGVGTPDIAMIVTDGQTFSDGNTLRRETEKFNQKGIKLEVIAVSSSNTDMSTINANEEQALPGMELINHLHNDIEMLKIYNCVHKEEPYIGAISSSISKKHLTFMGVKFEGLVPSFLDKVIQAIANNKEKIDWGVNQLSFKQFLSEIGKLFSVLFTEFPEEHFYVDKVINYIYQNCGLNDMPKDRILKIIKYGYECAKQKTPVIYTNFEQHVKEQAVKLAEFANAVGTLNQKGTTLGASKSICMPDKGVCVINNDRVLQVNKPLNEVYPNSQDFFENTYFGCDSDPQAIRIGMREYCGTVGYIDSKKSPCVIFHILNQMSLMFIKGADLESEHMRELRKLAIAQTSMENMVEHRMYSGVGFYEQWKAGKSVQMHFSSPRLHSSLFTAQIVNPLRLSQQVWWALMMSMLGLFNEQLSFYYRAMEAIGASNEREFLELVKSEFSSKVNGDVKFLKIKPRPKSIFTLDRFDSKDKVFVLKVHNNCDTRTHYSKEEIDSFVSEKGCVWCHHVPKPEDFEEVDLGMNPEQLIQKTLEEAKPITVENLEGFKSKLQLQPRNHHENNHYHRNSRVEQKQQQKLPKDSDFPVLTLTNEEPKKEEKQEKQEEKKEEGETAKLNFLDLFKKN
jgi:hypothetical protein